jgi:hypothetical protein
VVVPVHHQRLLRRVHLVVERYGSARQ